jgi:hypothetical protein
VQADSIVPLAERGEIHDYVMSLWSDGPIRRSHQTGGLVYRVIERFARMPRFFFRPSEQPIEWTHFSPWWGGILLCDYDNPVIRDLRYLHEIYHAATMPYLRDCNRATFEAMNFRNEREASCFTEIAIYCELPDLRPIAFDHPIFADRFLFPSGDRTTPDEDWLRRWREDRPLTFQALMYERARVILAANDEIDQGDPQIVWLRRYGEQGAAWIDIWSERFRLVQEEMVSLEQRARSGDRQGGIRDHLHWLLSEPITGGSDVPFRKEAETFRTTFDKLIEVYDEAMKARDQVAVRGRGEG